MSTLSEAKSVYRASQWLPEGWRVEATDEWLSVGSLALQTAVVHAVDPHDDAGTRKAWLTLCTRAWALEQEAR